MFMMYTLVFHKYLVGIGVWTHKHFNLGLQGFQGMAFGVESLTFL